MVHRDFLRLHVMGRLRSGHEALDRRALLQASLAVLVAGAVSHSVRADTLTLSPFEVSLGTGVANWFSRVNFAGSLTVAQSRLAAAMMAGAARGAPYLKFIGRWAGLVGVAWSVVEALSYVRFDDHVGRYVRFSTGTFTSANELEAHLVEDGVVTSNGVRYWRTFEPYGYAADKYASKGWAFWWQNNAVEPKPGYKSVIWAQAADDTPLAQVVPPLASTGARTVEALAGELQGENTPPIPYVPPGRLADVVATAAAEINDAYPGTFPPTAASPPIPTDFPPLPWHQIAAPSAADRDISLTTPATPPDPDPGDGGEGGEGGITWPSWPVTPWDEPGHDFGLPAFQFPSLSMPTGGECPKLTGTWKGNEVTMDPCPIATTARPMVSSLSTFLYWFAALRVMFASK